MKINTETIRKLNPCKDRFDNYLEHYADFSGSMVDFLELDNITAKDKIWVSVRLLPRFLVEVFAIDCALAAAGYAAEYEAYAAAYAAAYIAAEDNAAAYAAHAATYAANAAAYDAAAERENQVDALIMLVKGDYNEKDTA